MKISDEMLIRFADGLLDAQAAHELETRIKGNDEAIKKLRLIRLSSARLKLEKDRLDCDAGSVDIIDAPTDKLTAMILEGRLDPVVGKKSRADERKTKVINTRSRFGFLRALAASAVLFAIGLGTGLYLKSSIMAPALNPGQQSDLSSYPAWLVRVVDYHTLYSRETVAGSTATERDIVDYQNRFSNILKTPIVIPDMTEQRWSFRRGQVLKFKNDPIIQLAYLPKNTGSPIALCLKKTEARDNGPHFARIRGMATMRWRHRGIEYVLVGDVTEKEIRAAVIGEKGEILNVSRNL